MITALSRRRILALVAATAACALAPGAATAGAARDTDRTPTTGDANQQYGKGTGRKVG